MCVPDCAFDSEYDYVKIEKGECYAGTIAYSIGANGDVKACQCDIKTYGNILRDGFSEIYAQMSDWRTRGVIPEECSGCNREYSCRGGCRVEAYALGNDRRTLLAFAELKNVPVKYEKQIELEEFSEASQFCVPADVRFLRDWECMRVSAGISAAHLTNEFADWLEGHAAFTFTELLDASGVKREELNAILNMLARNKIIIQA